MHSRSDLTELIRNGENTFVEFKEDRVSVEALAKEFVAFANARGGVLLLGVGDDGGIVGLSRADDEGVERKGYRKLEEWVMQCGREKVAPPIIPVLELIREYEPGKDIAVITIGQGVEAHARRHNNHETYYVRVGSTSREASREELRRLFQRRGYFREELTPLPAAGYEALDERRLRDYFERLRELRYPANEREAVHLLTLTEYMASGETGRVSATLAGVLLFGSRPDRFFPGAVIEAAAFAVNEMSADVHESLALHGPLSALGPIEAPHEGGLVEESLAFVKRHTNRWLGVKEIAREEERPLPRIALREAIVNALIHRDYTMSTRPVLLRVFPDRVEIHSPGGLPNGITPESMRLGSRASRNQLLVDTMRDYGYVERLGLGIPTMIRTMREFNGTEPALVERDESFIVTLYR